MAKFNQLQILVTGGSGLLGGEIKKLLPKALYPASVQFNVENFEKIDKFIKGKKIKLIIHAAAATATHQIESNPLPALQANIVGTCNVVKLCLLYNIKLLYISTDYVFDGKKGNYKETDPVLPVNKYAWSKLGGEAAVRLMDNFVIVRTSFGPDKFPYDSAFTNQWTSKERVDAIAGKIVKLIKKRPHFVGVVHIGAKRRSVYDYAKSLDPKRKINKAKLSDIKAGGMARPKDVSLITALYSKLV